MKQELPKTVNLNHLLMSLIGLNDIQVEEFAEQQYKELFLKTKYSGNHTTHDGQQVSFALERFRHAFFKSPKKNEIEKSRVERMKWILPIIQGKALNYTCWLINDRGVIKRLYICYPLVFVIWLEPSLEVGKWIFSSAYPASRAKIREYLENRVEEIK